MMMIEHIDDFFYIITLERCSKDKCVCRYENGEKEHCLELWNRDGKVSDKKKFTPETETALEKVLEHFTISFFPGPSLERHPVFLRNLLRL